MNDDFSKQQIQWKLYQMASLGWRYLVNEQLEQAQETFEKGADLARRHQLHCQELSFEQNICQMYIYHHYDQKAAVDNAVRLVAKVARSQYADCTYEHVAVYDIMTHAYFYRDCLGYEKEIRESLDYIEQNLPMWQDTRLRIDYIRAELEYEHGRYQPARDMALKNVADAEFAHNYRKSDALVVARRAAFALGEIDLAHQYAAMDVTVGSERGVAYALTWQAVYAKRLGNDVAAELLFQRGLAQYKQFNIVHGLNYFDAVAEYYELYGASDKALELRQAQFQTLPARGSLHDMAIAHLQYCRLLGRMGKPVDAALQQAREFISMLRQPAVHEVALTRIEAGDFYQYDWQRETR